MEEEGPGGYEVAPQGRAGVPAVGVSGTESPGSAFGITVGAVLHWGKLLEPPAAAAAAESLPPAEGTEHAVGPEGLS